MILTFYSSISLYQFKWLFSSLAADVLVYFHIMQYINMMYVLNDAKYEYRMRLNTCACASLCARCLHVCCEESSESVDLELD